MRSQTTTRFCNAPPPPSPVYRCRVANDRGMTALGAITSNLPPLLLGNWFGPQDDLAMADSDVARVKRQNERLVSEIEASKRATQALLEDKDRAKAAEMIEGLRTEKEQIKVTTKREPCRSTVRNDQPLLKGIPQ